MKIKIVTNEKTIEINENDFTWWQQNKNLTKIQEIVVYNNEQLLVGCHNYDVYFLGLKKISINFNEPHTLVGIGAEENGKIEVLWFFAKDGSLHEKEIRTREDAGFFLHKNI